MKGYSIVIVTRLALNQDMVSVFPIPVRSSVGLFGVLIINLIDSHLNGILCMII